MLPSHPFADAHLYTVGSSAIMGHGEGVRMTTYPRASWATACAREKSRNRRLVSVRSVVQTASPGCSVNTVQGHASTSSAPENRTAVRPRSGTSLRSLVTAMMIIAAGTEPVSLRFVHNDDQLGKEQIGMILSGQWNDAENDVDERFSDSAYDESVQIATGELEAAVQEGRFDREWPSAMPSRSATIRIP